MIMAMRLSATVEMRLVVAGLRQEFGAVVGVKRSIGRQFVSYLPPSLT